MPLSISTRIDFFPSGGVQLALTFPHKRDWWSEVKAFRPYVDAFGEGYCLSLELGTGPGVETGAWLVEEGLALAGVSMD